MTLGRSLADEEGGGLRPALDLKLLVNAIEVVPNRLAAESERAPNLLIGATQRDKPQDLLFLSAQPVQRLFLLY